jgi:hypothetical protein
MKKFMLVTVLILSAGCGMDNKKKTTNNATVDLLLDYDYTSLSANGIEFGVDGMNQVVITCSASGATNQSRLQGLSHYRNYLHNSSQQFLQRHPTSQYTVEFNNKVLTQSQAIDLVNSGISQLQNVPPQSTVCPSHILAQIR